MRILLVMILGFILTACGEKPESVEVHGIMIGDSIKNVKDLSSYEKNDECEIVTYYKSPFKSYRSITIFEWKGDVQGITLIFNGENIDNETKSILQDFGEPISRSSQSGGVLFEYSEKGVLSKITAAEESPRGYVILASKKLDDNLEKVQKACYGE